jgi:hypothetical protein
MIVGHRSEFSLGARRRNISTTNISKPNQLLKDDPTASADRDERRSPVSATQSATPSVYGANEPKPQNALKPLLLLD